MAAVFHFPLERRLSFVRKLAEDLTAFNGEAANMFWRSSMAAIASEMRRIGFQDEDIKSEILHLQFAIQRCLEEPAVPNAS